MAEIKEIVSIRTEQDLRKACARAQTAVIPPQVSLPAAPPENTMQAIFLTMFDSRYLDLGVTSDEDDYG